MITRRPPLGPFGRPGRHTRPARTVFTLASALLCLVVVAACGSDGPNADAPRPPTSIDGEGVGVDQQVTEALATPVALVRVVDGLDAPTPLAARPGTDELWVTEQGGTVRRVTLANSSPDGRADVGDDRLDPDPVLDLDGLTEAGGERGLLGIAFSPTGGELYLHHTSPEGDIVVAAYPVTGAGAGAAGDPADRRVLLTVEHRRFPNHNGGQLVTDAEGLLYVGVGDGGGSGDPDDHAQTTSSLLGKILRIDPTRTADGRPYPSPPATPSLAAAVLPRSTCTGCATRGASVSTGPPATSGWPTSARTRSRRSPSCPPPPAPGGAPTSAGTDAKATARSVTAWHRPASSTRPSPTPTRPGVAR